jgi:hypothetical protein
MHILETYLVLLSDLSTINMKLLCGARRGEREGWSLRSGYACNMPNILAMSMC